MSDKIVNVLLIEDNSVDVLLVQEALSEVAHEHLNLLTTSTLAEGIAYLNTHKKVDIILADISLPDGNGIDIVHQLYKQFPQLPIVILTKLDDHELALNALNEGAQDFIIKGDRRGDQMVRILRYAIERHRLLLELEEKNQALQSAKIRLKDEVAARNRELQESEEHYHSVNNTAPLAFVVWDKDCTITDWNRNAEILFGWSAEEVLGQNFFEFLIPDDSQFQREIVVEALLNGELPSRIINENLSKSGDVIICEWNNTVLYDTERKVLGGLSLALDISERKRIGKALRDSESRFRSLIEQSPISTTLYTPDGKPTYGNPATAKLWNMTPELVKHVYQTYNIFEDSQLADQGIMPDIQKGFAGELSETQLIRYDPKQTDPNYIGPVRWLQAFIYPVKDEDGSISEVVVMHVDITERKQAEDALDESHERLVTVLDSIDADVYVSDMETYEILFINQHMRDSFDGNLNGKICWQVFRGESGPCPHCTNDQLLDIDGNPAGVIEWEGQNPVTGRWYINYDRAIKWVDNRIVRLQVATDITEYKKVSDELQSEKERLEEAERLVNMGSWELNVGSQFGRWSKQMFRMFRFESIDHVPSFDEFLIRIHPDDRPTVLEVLEQMTQGEIPIAGEFRSNPELGPLRIFNSTWNCISDESGDPARFQGTIQDITEHEQAERTLRKQAEELIAINTLGKQVAKSLAVDQIIDQTLRVLNTSVDADLTIIFLVQGRKLHLKGIYPENFLSRFGKISEHWVGECLCGLAVIQGEALYSRDIYSDERCTWDACKQIGIHSFAALPLWGGEEIIGVIGVASDSERDFKSMGSFLETLADQVATSLFNARLFETTQQELFERKQAEEALDVSEAKMQSIFQAAPIGIGVVIDRKIMDFNNQFSEMTGYTKAELIGKNARILYLSDEEYERVGDKKYTQIAEQGTGTVETQLKCKDGGIISVLLSSAPLNRKDLSSGVTFTVLDISKRKLAEDEIRQSHQQLRALTTYLQTAIENERSYISREIHDDFGQLLTALKMDLIGVSQRIPDTNPELATRIGRMTALVDDSIDKVQKLSSRLRPGLLDDLGLSAAIEWQAQTFQEYAGIECTLDVPEFDQDLPSELATGVFRIFQETLTNIARHSQATAVNIRLGIDDNELHLKVQDNGRGITVDEITGYSSLGLLGMQERVRSFKGEIDFLGVDGEGTTVVVRIPLGPEIKEQAA